MVGTEAEEGRPSRFGTKSQFLSDEARTKIKTV